MDFIEVYIYLQLVRFLQFNRFPPGVDDIIEQLVSFGEFLDSMVDERAIFNFGPLVLHDSDDVLLRQHFTFVQDLGLSIYILKVVDWGLDEFAFFVTDDVFAFLIFENEIVY